MIDSKYAHVSKNMHVTAGVELSESGKVVAGGHYKQDGRLSLLEYAKLNDPKQQQAQQMQH